MLHRLLKTDIFYYLIIKKKKCDEHCDDSVKTFTGEIHLSNETSEQEIENINFTHHILSMHLSQTTKSIAVVKYFSHTTHSTLRQLNFRAGFLERSPLLPSTIVVIVSRRDDIFLATRMMLFGCSFDFVLLLLATDTPLLLADRLITFSLAAISEALEYRRFEMLLGCSFD